MVLSSSQQCPNPESQLQALAHVRAVLLGEVEDSLGSLTHFQRQLCKQCLNIGLGESTLFLSVKRNSVCGPFLAASVFHKTAQKPHLTRGLVEFEEVLSM